MKLYEMEGFLRGKCIPGDMKVNETNAEYLVRKFSEADSEITHLKKKLSVINSLMEAAEQASKLAQEATEKLVQERNALAAENAGLKAFKTAVYQQMGAGCEAPEFSITEGLSNLRRFADTLHAIEREFFTKEVPDEECEGETVEECPLGWGMSVEQYVAEFRKCLAEVRAQGVDMAACALDDVNQFNYANMLDELAQKIRKGAQS